MKSMLYETRTLYNSDCESVLILGEHRTFNPIAHEMPFYRENENARIRGAIMQQDCFSVLKNRLFQTTDRWGRAVDPEGVFGGVDNIPREKFYLALTTHKPERLIYIDKLQQNADRPTSRLVRGLLLVHPAVTPWTENPMKLTNIEMCIFVILDCSAGEIVPKNKIVDCVNLFGEKMKLISLPALIKLLRQKIRPFGFDIPNSRAGGYKMVRG